MENKERRKTEEKLLVSQTEVDNANLYALLSNNADSITNVNILGGEQSVTFTTRCAVLDAIGGQWVPGI